MVQSQVSWISILKMWYIRIDTKSKNFAHNINQKIIKNFKFFEYVIKIDLLMHINLIC